MAEQLAAQGVTADELNQLFFDLEAEGKYLMEEFKGKSAGFCDRVLQLGDALLRKKLEVGHGQWMQWSAQNLLFSAETAQIYMRVAKAKSQRATDFNFDSIRGAIKELTSAEQLPQQLDMLQDPAKSIRTSWIGKATERFFAKAGKAKDWDDVAKRDLKFLLDEIITLAKKVGVDVHPRAAVTLEAERVS